MRNEIIEALDESVRRRIESNLQHYAPFLAMLTAWKQAIEADLEAAEQRVMHRLLSQHLPAGEWRFPAQTLAVPQEPLQRDWDVTKSFYDPLSATEWIPSGRGWTLPTRLESGQLLPLQNQSLLILNFVVTSPLAGQTLLTSEQGQLLFVAAEESFLQALSQAQWFVQQPRQGLRRAETTRYEGYLEFERELAVSRWSQRHLEAWLPPFYPYSRKFLHIRPARSSDPAPLLPFIDECPPQTLRLIAIVDESTASRLQSASVHSLFLPNALPVIQASCMQQQLAEIPFEVGEQTRATFAGVVNCFCAIAYRETQPLRARFEVERAHEESSLESLLAKRLGVPVNVYCDTDATLVKIYFNTVGEEVTRPSVLEAAREARFNVPFPPVGALNQTFSDESAEGVHYHLYHNFLRPAMLTEGDVHEILRHVPSIRQIFDLSATQIEISLEDYPLSASLPWHNYLWPSVVSDAPLIERQIRSMAHSGVFITPLLRLKLTPQPHFTDLPRFIVEEGARHAASVISQFFQLGMYVVVGESI